MREVFGKKKIAALASIVLVSSGLMAWSLIALFQADNARLESENFPEENFQDEGSEPAPPEDLEETELESSTSSLNSETLPKTQQELSPEKGKNTTGGRSNRQKR